VHWWIIGLAANALIALSYLGIVGYIALPLVNRSRVTQHKLAAAAAVLFFACAIHHGLVALHLLLPSLGVDVARGLAMRDAWGWDLALWGVVGAGAAAYYLSQRRTYGSLLRCAQLVDDLRRRERQALKINDDVLQGLVVAKLALELDQRDTAVAALDTAIASASRIISGLLDHEGRPLGAGLLRTSSAVLEPADQSLAAAGQSRSTRRS